MGRKPLFLIKNMIAYKFVSNIYNRYLSFNIRSENEQLEGLEDLSIIEYFPGRKVYPKVENTKLFCFPDIESALKFSKIGGYLELWKCEVDELEVFSGTINTDETKAFDFWKDGKLLLKDKGLYVENFGLSGWVKLIEKI